MSWKSEVTQALTGLTAPSAGGTILRVGDGRRELECELVALDLLACAFSSFSVRIPALADAGVDRLKDLAGRLAARLSYLLEPIGLVEVDADHCTVQLRSLPPQRDDDRTEYYELLARRGGVFSLRRYQVLPGQPREVIPAHVTREVLVRLADDFGSLAE